MNLKFVSDLDYSFNPVTGNYDVPAVEWENDFGRFWERFESEEARSLALAKNEAYNSTPEAKAYIQEMNESEDKWRAERYTSELFDHALENNSTVALSDVIEFAGISNKYVVKLVCTHNKLMLKAKQVPAPAVNTIADFM